VINLPRLRALEAALKRGFAAATLFRCTFHSVIRVGDGRHHGNVFELFELHLEA
jgi:hypothetical protein